MKAHWRYKQPNPHYILVEVRGANPEQRQKNYRTLRRALHATMAENGIDGADIVFLADREYDSYGDKSRYDEVHSRFTQAMRRAKDFIQQMRNAVE